MLVVFKERKCEIFFSFDNTIYLTAFCESLHCVAEDWAEQQLPLVGTDPGIDKLWKQQYGNSTSEIKQQLLFVGTVSGIDSKGLCKGDTNGCHGFSF